MAKSEQCGCRVSLQEIAYALNWSSLTAGDVKGYQVTPDWAGRPSVSVEDAARLVVELQARAERARADREEKERAVREEYKRKADLRKDAWKRAYDQGMRNGCGNPISASMAREAVQLVDEQGYSVREAVRLAVEKVAMSLPGTMAAGSTVVAADVPEPAADKIHDETDEQVEVA